MVQAVVSARHMKLIFNLLNWCMKITIFKVHTPQNLKNKKKFIYYLKVIFPYNIQSITVSFPFTEKSFISFSSGGNIHYLKMGVCDWASFLGLKVQKYVI